jgi:hypothetical protein
LLYLKVSLISVIIREETKTVSTPQATTSQHKS